MPSSESLSYSRLRELELRPLKILSLIFLPLVRIALGMAAPRLPQVLAYQIDFLSVMAVGLVNRLRTDMCKVLYLLLCRFLRL